MTNTNRIRMAFLVMGVAMTGASQLHAQPASKNAQHAVRPATQADSMIPVMIFKEDLVVFIDQPSEHLLNARGYLERGNAGAAAREVYAAARYVRIEAHSAHGSTQVDLTEAANDLDHIAARVSSGRIDSAHDLDGALRHTDRALARHHLERASRALARKDAATAGRELRGAADYTLRLAKDGGHDVERGTMDVVDAARLVSGKLIQGIGWATDEVGKAFGALGREVERLSKDIEPHSKHARAK